MRRDPFREFNPVRETRRRLVWETVACGLVGILGALFVWYAPELYRVLFGGGR